MSWNGRDMYGNIRHEHIHCGWTVTFDMDGKRWQMKLGPQYKTKRDVKYKILTKYPTATKISYNKHICEV